MTGPAHSSKGVTAEQLALIVELLPTIGSLRDLCAVTGLRLDTVRRKAAPFLAIMKIQGTHPQCGCGRDRFHPYGCADSVAKSSQAGRVPGSSPRQAPEVMARRARIIEMLLDGSRFVDIDNALGLYPKSARKYLRFLSPAQLAIRDERIREHAAELSKMKKAA